MQKKMRSTDSESLPLSPILLIIVINSYSYLYRWNRKRKTVRHDFSSEFSLMCLRHLFNLLFEISACWGCRNLGISSSSLNLCPCLFTSGHHLFSGSTW